jgi:adenylate kinase
MRAIVFGQSGIAKEDYICKEVLPIAKAHGRAFEVISLGREMRKLDTFDRDPASYPDLPVTERELLRRQALSKILAEVEKKINKKKDYVLIAHAVFMVDTGLIAATDIDLFRRFSPDVIIVLIDDFHYVARRLKEANHYQYLSLADILEWRDAEITTAKAIAQQILRNGKTTRENDWRFFVFGVRKKRG